MSKDWRYCVDGTSAMTLLAEELEVPSSGAATTAVGGLEMFGGQFIHSSYKIGTAIRYPSGRVGIDARSIVAPVAGVTNVSLLSDIGIRAGLVDDISGSAVWLRGEFAPANGDESESGDEGSLWRGVFVLERDRCVLFTKQFELGTGTPKRVAPHASFFSDRCFESEDE
jgi:hypothetical protein